MNTAKRQLNSQTNAALDQVRELGAMNSDDPVEVKQRKLNALFALSDAMIADGMETWSPARIDAEIGESRRKTSTS